MQGEILADKIDNFGFMRFEALQTVRRQRFGQPVVDEIIPVQLQLATFGLQ